MKKITNALLAVVCLPLILQGCGSSDDANSGPKPSGPAVFEPRTHPRFDPVNQDLPFNTDLIFAAAATSDGTANVGAATDPVRAALNMLDGFSTSAFFDVLIQGSVNPASVIPMQTVFLLELNTAGKDALDPANVIGFTGPAAFDTQVVSVDGGNNNAIRIRPTTPLKPKTKYLVVLTNDIKDAADEPLTPSWTYNALGDPDYPTLASLMLVRTAILGWEKLAAGFLASVNEGLSPTAATEKLVLTYTFTTTDPQTPLVAMASPRAAIAALQISAGEDAATAVDNVVALDNAGLLPTPRQRPLGLSEATGVDFAMASSGMLAGGVGKLYTGYIELPYYLTGPDDLPFGAFLTRHWTPDTGLAGALGITVPADVDGSLNVTYRYPFAARTTDESVPLQVTLPEADWVPGYAGVLSCGQIYEPSGYPVVIYIHGITSDRTSVLALGHTLASRCIATVAIDLPMHGVPATSDFVAVLNTEKSTLIPFATLYGDRAPRERHFNVAGPGGAPAPMNFEAPGATDGSGAQFINLGYLANTRDNIRQAVMDLLNLNASLAGLNDALEPVSVGIDLNRVYVVGQSLGGIVGTTFTTVNQMAIANDAQVGLTSNLNPVRGLIASTAGSQVSQILVNSATFAPIINNGLAAAGVDVGTSNYERFLYAAQSTLDSGDPVNFAQTLGMLSVPVLLQQVNNDLVIPNAAQRAPLAGTEPLAELLGAEQLDVGMDQPLGQGIVKLTEGDHGSLLRPSSTSTNHITGELQTQVVTFVLNDGEVTIGAMAPENIEPPEDEAI